MVYPVNRPTPIRTDGSNWFAHNTMRVRVPDIIREVQALNPDYPAPIQHALETLIDGLETNAPVPMLDLPAPDYDEWAVAYAFRRGDTWQNTDWFFAENYVYRQVIQAVRWWETARDPFAPRKAEELTSDRLWRLLDETLAVEGTTEERLSALIHRALWGNRIDLSYAPSLEHGHAADADDLLVDESAQAVRCLLTRRGPVHIVADNAGTELALDLALADRLLDGVAHTVIVHLKMHPTFVSDATLPDALRFLDLLESDGRSREAAAFGGRLRQALVEKRLRFAPDLYWNGCRILRNLPPRLEDSFRRARLVVFKGDANYRRMVGDILWPPETPLARVVDRFPAPILALRSLKSDPIVGLPPGLAEQIDSIDPDWHTNGRRGVIQTTAT